ncbi:MAG: DUF3473 domain-containing protein [Candidatus Omnitrophota bacterium]|nr:DUF3473 domain-containing protein [Candidatus Omnitrophota bacterium]
MSAVLDSPLRAATRFPAFVRPELLRRSSSPKNILTIDVEDWFHVTNFESQLPFSRWNKLASRIQYSMPRLLDLLAKYRAHATFFTLGWVARRFPSLVKRIVREGHEIASHGENHRLVRGQRPREFRNQLVASRDILEQISGEAVKGHRAPSYSLDSSTLWSVGILFESGFEYDSSVFPFGFRRDPEWCDKRFPCRLGDDGLGSIAEYPLSTLRLAGRNLPVAGGGYFRFLPYSFTRWAVKQLNEEGHSAVMYLHPWELDPGQPRVRNAPWLSRFRHYHRLESAEAKFSRLLADFRFHSIRDVYWSRWTERYEITPQI